MIDILKNEVYVGDKIAYLPTKDYMTYSMQIGIITKLSKSNNACWCKSVIKDTSELLRYSNQIIKL